MSKFEEIEKLFHRKPKVGKLTVSIGMSYTIFQHTLEPHIDQLPFDLIAHFGEETQLLADLNSGALDFILTSQKIAHANLIFTPFINERIILICSNRTDKTQLEQLISTGEPEEIRDWLEGQNWFTTSVDMEYLKTFWQQNFNKLPTFKPRFVIPNFNSILRCLETNDGFAVIPDSICKKEIENDVIKLAWEGNRQLENTLHFGKRKKTNYPKEFQQLEEILSKNWFS